MLEAIRRLGVEKRWVFGLVLGIVTVTFIGTMGWMGMTGPTGAYAAKVNGEAVLLADFQQAYRNTYRDYERMLGDKFKPELIESLNLPIQVVMGLVDRKLWLSLGHDLGISATDDEVRKALMDIQAFQVNGRFNSRQYREVLSRIQSSAEVFEDSVRDDLVIEQARRIVGSAVRLTDADLKSLPPPEAGLSKEEAESKRADQRRTLLDRKRSQLLMAYTAQMRKEATIEIYRENMKV
jgi:peptidyl-prolyl cis-trans isomerase D